MAPELMASRVHGEAAGGHRPGPVDMPSSLRGEGGSEDACVGGRERADADADAAGLGASLMRTGPWNRKERPSRSGSDSEVRSSYYPRRKAGSFVGCWGKDFLRGEGHRKEGMALSTNELYSVASGFS